MLLKYRTNQPRTREEEQHSHTCPTKSSPLGLFTKSQSAEHSPQDTWLVPNFLEEQ